jgi:hypothetical protein
MTIYQQHLGIGTTGRIFEIPEEWARGYLTSHQWRQLENDEIVTEHFMRFALDRTQLEAPSDDYQWKAGHRWVRKAEQEPTP